MEGAMEKENRGMFLKFIMTLSFLAGAIGFFFSLMYADEVLCKVGFGILTFFSLLCAFGINAADASAALYIRASTKLAAVMFPLSVNGGALAAAVLLMRDKELPAVIAVITSAAVSVISSSVLVRRYMEDDF